MKTFTLLLAVTASVAAHGQAITIDSSDAAIMGRTIIMATDTSSMITLTPGPAGANQTWNFSTAVAGTKDTVTFGSPVGTPYAAQFPNATVHASVDSTHLYLVKTATALFMDGSADATLGIWDINPNEQMLAFPSTMGTNFSNTSSYEFSFPSGFPAPAPDSIRIVFTKTKTSTVDAWGAVTTPGGTYNSLRVKSIGYTVDSTFIHFPLVGWSFDSESYDTSYTYDWWAKDEAYPVITMDSSSFGTYVSFLLPILNDIKQVNRLHATIYPNPAKNQLYISTHSARISVVIYDLKGSVIREEKNLNGNTAINVADLTAGMYLYSITDNEGKTARGRFNVSH